MKKENRTAATDKGKASPKAKQVARTPAAGGKGEPKNTPSGYKLSGYKASGSMNKVKKGN